MWRILIDHKPLEDMLALKNITGVVSLSAKYKPNAKKLIISGKGIETLIAPKALLDWTVPGS